MSAIAGIVVGVAVLVLGMWAADAVYERRRLKNRYWAAMRPREREELPADFVSRHISDHEARIDNLEARVELLEAKPTPVGPDPRKSERSP